VPAAPTPFRFFLLTFALAAPFWVLGFLVASPDRVPMDMPVSALMFVCPGLAATLLTWRSGGRAAVRALWARLLVPPRPVRWAWYAAAPLVSAGPLLVHALAHLAGVPVTAARTTLPALLALVALYLVAAAAEEAGWTAYATDALCDRWGAAPAAVVIGVVTSAWHVVPWSQVHPPDWVAWQFLASVALRVLWTWVYANTGRSVPAVVACHLFVNLWGTLTPTFDSPAAHAATAAVTTAAAAAVLLLWDGRTLARPRRRAHRAAGTAPEGRP